MNVTTIGLDLAKQVFQVHGIDEAGETVVKRRLRRSALLVFFEGLAPCVVAMEACATAHFWGRSLARLGHEVRLIPPRYVKPYVKRNKTDAADAAAICEAAGRPGMHFVAVKSEAQQGVLVLHRSRELLVRQRTMTGNALRAHLAEFGIVAAQGKKGLAQLVEMVRDAAAGGLPEEARAALMVLAAQWEELELRIDELERRIKAWHRGDETSRRLESIPGIGPLTASALVATVGDPKAFATGRHFAAWLGLVPRERSSALKRRRGRISKQGNDYLRRLLVLGSTSVMRHIGRRRSPPGATEAWLNGLRARRPAKVVAVALANKNARIAWAVMARGETYRRRPAAA
jgi:transposase